MTRLIASFALLVGLSLHAHGQTVKRFHQNFEIEDVTTVQIAADGDVQVNTWSGNSILVEVYVETKQGTPALLGLLQKDGRYDLDIQKSATSLVVVNKVKHRQQIKVKGQDLDETIRYTISVPDIFKVRDTEKMRDFQRTR